MIKIVNVIRSCLKQEKVTFTPRNAINLFSGNYVRVSKYKNIFAQGYTSIWPAVVSIV